MQRLQLDSTWHAPYQNPTVDIRMYMYITNLFACIHFYCMVTYTDSLNRVNQVCPNTQRALTGSCAHECVSGLICGRMIGANK